MPQSAHRNRRLRMAVTTSLVSKVAGAAVQLASLPLILSGLGEERYAAFLAMSAATQWTSIMGVGILPSLTRELAASAAAGDRKREQQLVGAGFWFSLLIATLVFLVAMLVIFAVDTRAMLGIGGTIERVEAQLGFATAMGLIALHFFASLAGAVRAGYQESHLTNIISLISHVFIVASLILLHFVGGNLISYIAAIMAPLTLLLMVDMARLFRGRTYLWPPALPHLADLRGGTLRGLTMTSGVTWAAQIHYFLTVFLTVVIVSRWSGVQETNAFGSMMRAMVLGNSMIGLLVWPMIPALTDAWARSDVVWARRSALRLWTFTLVLGSVGSGIIALFGPELVRSWLGAEIEISGRMALGFALYFLGWNITFACFNMLLAIDKVQKLGWWLLAEAGAALLLANLLRAHMGGGEAMALGLGVATVAMNFWLQSLRLSRWTRTLGSANPALDSRP